MSLIARLFLVLGLRRAEPAPTRSWRDPRPVLIGAPLVEGAALSGGEAP